MRDILLIGAGQLGSRHLQGLMKCRLPVRVEVVEPDEQNSITALERARQIEGSGNIEGVTFKKSIDEISIREPELIIVATNADVRAEVITKLTGKVKISNLILEKVVYQSIEVFEKQLSLLGTDAVKTWVNCPRRIYPFYRTLKNELPGGEKISLTVSGSSWGLGCNSLHFIDLFCFLTGNSDCRPGYTLLDPEILESKRKGFVEFTGRMGFSNSSGQLHLASYDFPGIPVLIEVACAGRRWIIDEIQGNVVYFSEIKNVKPEISNTRFPFQSDLTNLLTEEILTTGNCGLTGLKESYYQHSLLLPLLNDHLFAIRGVRPENCPIT